MSDWKTIETAPEGRIVATKIDDMAGTRNESLLKRHRNMWFIPDGSMYVYYAPTHCRELDEDEKEALAKRASKLLADASAAANQMLESI